MKRLLVLCLLPLTVLAAVVSFDKALPVKQYKAGVLTGKTFATPDACRLANEADARVNNSTKTSGSITYRCVDTPNEATYVATFGASSSSSSASSSSASSSSASSSSSSSSPPLACARNSGSYVMQASDIYGFKVYGNYIVAQNNWGGASNQITWSNSEGCWGVTTGNTDPNSQQVFSYPSVTRGWSQNQGAMQALGGTSWTVRSGMGIRVDQLTKAKVRWAVQKGAAPKDRTLGLIDVYIGDTNNPEPTAFPLKIDLMIDQWLSDQVFTCCGAKTYYDYVAQQNKASRVTIAGQQYLIYVDHPGEAHYHSAGGHTLHLFREPTSFPNGDSGPNWGATDGVTDVAAIIKYFMQANPKNDAGQPLVNASGAAITSPLIASNLFLNSVNAGPEVIATPVFTTTAFCVAMQAEPDC